MFSVMSVCHSVLGGVSRVTTFGTGPPWTSNMGPLWAPDPPGHQTPSPSPLTVIYGGDYWRPVRTCLFGDLQSNIW